MEINENIEREGCEADGNKELHRTAAESRPRCQSSSRIGVNEVDVQNMGRSIGRDDSQDGYTFTMGTKIVPNHSSPKFRKGRVGKNDDDARRSVVKRIGKNLFVEASTASENCPSLLPHSSISSEKSRAKTKARVEETDYSRPNDLECPISLATTNHSTDEPPLIPPDITKGLQIAVAPLASSPAVGMDNIPNHEAASTERGDFGDEGYSSRDEAAVFEAYTVEDPVIVPAETVASETGRAMPDSNDAAAKSAATRSKTWEKRCKWFLDIRVLVVVALVIVATTITTTKQLDNNNDGDDLGRISPSFVAPKAGARAEDLTPNPTIPPSSIKRPAENHTETSSVQRSKIPPSTVLPTTRDALKPCEGSAGCWTKIGSDLIGPVDDDQWGEEVALGTFASGRTKNITRFSVSAVEDNSNGNFSGAVYTYDWNEETGTFDSVGTPLHGSSGDERFRGKLSRDGRRLVVGTGYYGGLGAEERNIGQVSVYELVGGEWEILGDPLRGKARKERFGASFDISSDGSVFVASATFSNEKAGCLRVYRFDGKRWSQMGDDMIGPLVGEQFGWAVAISGDGKVVAGGPRGQNLDTDFGDMGFNSGFVRVYRYENEGWVLVGGTLAGEAAGDNFGRSVSLSYDGNVVAAGTWVIDRNDTDPSSSRVRVFSYDEAGEKWTLMGGSGLSPFGASDWPHRVSLSADGVRMAVSAGEFGEESIGSVVVYEFADGEWEPFGGVITGVQKIIAPFISLSADGRRILIGHPLSIQSPDPVKGLVRLFAI